MGHPTHENYVGRLSCISVQILTRSQGLVGFQWKGPVYYKRILSPTDAGGLVWLQTGPFCLGLVSTGFGGKLFVQHPLC